MSRLVQGCMSFTYKLIKGGSDCTSHWSEGKQSSESESKMP